MDSTTVISATQYSSDAIESLKNLLLFAIVTQFIIPLFKPIVNAIKKRISKEPIDIIAEQTQYHSKSMDNIIEDLKNINKNQNQMELLIRQSLPNRLDDNSAIQLFGHIMQTHIVLSASKKFRDMTYNYPNIYFDEKQYEECRKEWIKFSTTLSNKTYGIFSTLFLHKNNECILDFFGEKGVESVYRHLITSLFYHQNLVLEARKTFDYINIESRLSNTHSCIWGKFKLFTSGRGGINGWEREFEPFVDESEKDIEHF